MSIYDRMNQPKPTFPICELRVVRLYYVDTTMVPPLYFVHMSEVDTFVEASKRLHFNPGKNPHNGNVTAKVWKITVAEMESRGPFWWTTPDLQNNGDAKGARIIDGGSERIVFSDAEQVARWRAEEAESEALVFREQERLAREAKDAA